MVKNLGDNTVLLRQIDPRSDQIMRQHSQEMALRYFALNGTVPSTVQLRDMTSWFQRDINHQPIKEELE